MWLPTIVKEFDSPDLHMKEKDAIYACLPIITAATKGDLDKEISLKCTYIISINFNPQIGEINHCI
jgi:hypothetical protein